MRDEFFIWCVVWLCFLYFSPLTLFERNTSRKIGIFGTLRFYDNEYCHTHAQLIQNVYSYRETCAQKSGWTCRIYVHLYITINMLNRARVKLTCRYVYNIELMSTVWYKRTTASRFSFAIPSRFLHIFFCETI